MGSNLRDHRARRRIPWHVRTTFAIAGHLTPALAERRAAELFLTPRPFGGRAPTDLHASLLPERTLQRQQGEDEPGFVTLPTGRTALWSWGHGPTVLLVHGWSGQAGDMAFTAAAFVRAGYRAVLFDMPGHGASGRGPTSLFSFVQTIGALTPLVGPIDTIIAHSLGATAATVALGQQATIARRAILLAPGISPWAFTRQFAETLGLPTPRIPGMVRQIERMVGATANSLDAAAAARDLSLPGKIFHDPGDTDVPFAHAALIAASWRGASLVARRGLGHRRLLRDSTTLAAMVRFANMETEGVQSA
jgi:pimeloyl-ACP methyl ester carboxylesterase